MDLGSLTQGLPGFGVRFLPMSEESKALVKHLVDVGGTGRGQAKTLPYTSPEALKSPTREPLHAPVSAIMANLTPTDRAPTGDWPALAPQPAELKSEPKVIVNFDEPEELQLGSVPLDGASEPMLDRASVQAAAAEAPIAFRRRSAGVASWAAGFVLVAAVAGGGVFAWRGFHEAQVEPAAEPVTVVTAQDLASPEGQGETTAAALEADDADEPEAAAEAAPVAAKAETKPVEAAKPAPAPAKTVVAEAKPAPAPAVKPVEAKPAPKPAPRAEPRAPARPALAQIALPSGAAKAVGVSTQGSQLQIEPELAPGSSIDRVFALSGPSRLVIDLKGPAPKGTPRVAGRDGVTSVRLGSRPGGTRLVLDLTRSAGKVKTANGAITVELK